MEKRILMSIFALAISAVFVSVEMAQQKLAAPPNGFGPGKNGKIQGMIEKVNVANKDFVVQFHKGNGTNY